jgi:prepilin-type processing-associated H-X9-DG protein
MSYGLNTYVFTPFFDLGTLTSGSSSQLYTDVFALKRRDNVPLLFDSVGPNAALGTSPPKKEPTIAGEAMCINRHNGNMGVLFLDWSVRSVGLKALWTLKWNLRFNTAGPWMKAGGVEPEDWPAWMRGFKDY